MHYFFPYFVTLYPDVSDEPTEITFTGSGSADVKGGVTQVSENGKEKKSENYQVFPA